MVVFEKRKNYNNYLVAVYQLFRQQKKKYKLEKIFQNTYQDI